MKERVMFVGKGRIGVAGAAGILLLFLACSRAPSGGPTTAADSQPSDREPVTVINEPMKLESRIADALPKEVAGVILVTPGKSAEDAPSISAFTRMGQLINLCGSSPKRQGECKLDATASDVAYMVQESTESPEPTKNRAGVCYPPGDSGKRCHKNGDFANQYYYHRKHKAGVAHTDCGNEEPCS
jgi:hypothetical protein